MKCDVSYVQNCQVVTSYLHITQNYDSTTKGRMTQRKAREHRLTESRNTERRKTERIKYPTQKAT